MSDTQQFSFAAEALGIAEAQPNKTLWSALDPTQKIPYLLLETHALLMEQTVTLPLRSIAHLYNEKMTNF